MPGSDMLGAKPRVLAIGVYLDDLTDNVQAIHEALHRSAAWDVEDRWLAMGMPHVPDRLESLTDRHSPDLVPRFRALNTLLGRSDLEQFDVVLVLDDDVTLDDGWLDRYLSLQRKHDLALAQPARTPNSYIDHPFTGQLLGVEARETRFVEIGPVVSLDRRAVDALLPFDTAWPMGWGLDLVWPLIIRSAGLRMGIIDAAPVEHSARAPQVSYSATAARSDMHERLDRVRHLPRPEAQTVVVPAPEATRASTSGRLAKEPSISVVLATRNRSRMLEGALNALAVQTLPPSEFEVVVVDDGSTDDTAAVVADYDGIPRLTYVSQEASGLASARNHGLFASTASLVLFLDDDDTADARLLEAHVLAHRKYLNSWTAILGYTGLGGRARASTLMQHLVGRGSQLFSYGHVRPHQPLDYMNFWGGRSSAKRTFLLEHGVFDPQFTFGAEDIELGYRLARFGFEVVYVPEAVSWMQRALSWDDFLDRTRRQGRSYAAVQRKHPDTDMLDRLGIHHALRSQDELLTRLQDNIRQARSLLDLADRWQDLELKVSELASIRTGAFIDAAYWGTLLQGCMSSGVVMEAHRDDSEG